MINKQKIIGILLGWGLLFLLTSNILLAQNQREVNLLADKGQQIRHFKKIEQPLSLKLLVAFGGLVLISAELWWFIYYNQKE